MNQAKRGEEARSKVDAMKHPLRLAIHDLLMMEPLSVTELARRLGVPVGRVRYQVGRLKEAGLAELRELRPKRGMAERVYSSSPAYITPADGAHLTTDELEAGVKAILKRMIRDSLNSVETGKFVARPEFVAARFPLRIDQQGWKQAADLLQETVERSLAVQAEAAKRLEHGGGEEVKAYCYAFLFEAAGGRRLSGPAR